MSRLEAPLPHNHQLVKLGLWFLVKRMGHDSHFWPWVDPWPCQLCKGQNILYMAQVFLVESESFPPSLVPYVAVFGTVLKRAEGAFSYRNFHLSQPTKCHMLPELSLVFSVPTKAHCMLFFFVMPPWCSGLYVEHILISYEEVQMLPRSITVFGTHSCLWAIALARYSPLGVLSVNAAGSIYKGWSLRTGTLFKLISRIKAST